MAFASGAGRGGVRMARGILGCCFVRGKQRSYGVTASTLDSESSDRGSNPRGTFSNPRGPCAQVLQARRPGVHWGAALCALRLLLRLTARAGGGRQPMARAGLVVALFRNAPWVP